MPNGKEYDEEGKGGSERRVRDPPSDSEQEPAECDAEAKKGTNTVSKRRISEKRKIDVSLEDENDAEKEMRGIQAKTEEEQRREETKPEQKVAKTIGKKNEN